MSTSTFLAATAAFPVSEPRSFTEVQDSIARWVAEAAQRHADRQAVDDPGDKRDGGDQEVGNLRGPVLTPLGEHALHLQRPAVHVY